MARHGPALQPPNPKEAGPCLWASVEVWVLGIRVVSGLHIYRNALIVFGLKRPRFVKIPNRNNDKSRLLIIGSRVLAWCARDRILFNRSGPYWGSPRFQRKGYGETFRVLSRRFCMSRTSTRPHVDQYGVHAPISLGLLCSTAMPADIAGTRMLPLFTQ